MERDTYDKAKNLIKLIDHTSIAMTQVRKMKERKDDKEFNLIRDIAYNYLSHTKERYEQDFKDLK